MTLADFTRPALLVPELTGHDAAAVLHELSFALQRAGCITDWLQFYNDALNREFLDHSAVTSGVVLIQVRSAAVETMAFALGRCSRSIQWDARTLLPAQLIVLLAVPAGDATACAAVFAGLQRLVADDKRREQLRFVPHELQALAVLRGIGVPEGLAAALPGPRS